MRIEERLRVASMCAVRVGGVVVRKHENDWEPPGGQGKKRKHAPLLGSPC